MQPFKVLTASVRSLPAMKYALAVAGLAAVVALVSAFRLSPAIAVIGSVVVIALMVVVFLFVRLTATASRHFFMPVMVMMWALLALFVATATLLFTSAFFQWPRGLSELIAPAASAQNPRAPRNTPVTLAPLLATARAMLGAHDYPAAWKAAEDARQQQPDSAEVKSLRADVAMIWLRNARVSDGQGFSGLVTQLTPALFEALPEAAGARAADINAHIGWGNFLKYRDGVRGLPIEEQYRAATELDPPNPFARAMWGHWLATQRRPLAEVEAQFHAALTGSDRERAYVREMQLAALRWLDTPESAAALLRVSDEMRRRGEALSPDTRAALFTAIYFAHGRQAEAVLLSALPVPGPRHLETFHWLSEDRNVKQDGTAAYFLARLTEASGDTPGALALYRAIDREASAFSAQITAGIARCNQSLQAATR